MEPPTPDGFWPHSGNVIRVAARRDVRRRLAAGIALILAFVLFSWAAARMLVVQIPIAGADAIVVMAGARDYLERTESAARLFSAGRAPRVVLSDDGVQG